MDMNNNWGLFIDIDDTPYRFKNQSLLHHFKKNKHFIFQIVGKMLMDYKQNYYFENHTIKEKDKYLHHFHQYKLKYKSS